MSEALRRLAAAEVATAIRRGEITATNVVDASLERADAVGAGRDGLNIVLHEDRDAARAEARRLDDAGPRDGALAGVPVAIKDNIATLRLPTSCGSRILEGYVSPFEATAVRRLREAGAVVLAKTNMDEFAMGSSTEHSAFGPTRNPLDPSRVPGGSSGGSAAAVAAGMVRVALGSETGGSVRQPAAFCGIVGIKPTYGRVSRYGLVAFASSLDQIGVFGRTVDDAALGLGVIAGQDPRDATSAAQPVPEYRAAARESIRGLVVGRPREYFPESLDPRIRECCDAALATLASSGAEVRDVSLPHTDLAIPVYYIVAPAEASSNLARFDGVRYGLRMTGDGLRGMYEATRSHGFGPEVTRRILLGTYVLSAGYYDAYYRKAMAVRALIARDFREVFRSGVHVLLTPTTPTPAFALGAISDPYDMYLSDIFTATANLAGVPGLSLPVGSIDGLPVGAQLLAAHFDEYRMLAVAYALERALGGGRSGVSA
ncbi:MAG TPA: Asp-tRNA(Asn)/Glu-tRNA(Gln) amidotransferase subunit GatA [Gemmatimonadaceae bacterium]|nr:Asp-tRNA(Asn)/Glu-tRNA(Gln) amidotransferase subunit GatA [Gemmatimonadaceae bacterium]